jgi:hypothetical protein
MVKNLKRIAVIILLLIGMGYNYCYADLVTLSYLPIFDGGTIIIGTMVLIIISISFYLLQDTVKNSNSLNTEENKKDNKNRAYNIIMIIAIIVHCFSLLLVHCFSLLLVFNEIGILIWLIPIILFIMSKAIRTSSKKISNIFWIISMFIIVLMFIYNICVIIL